MVNNNFISWEQLFEETVGVYGLVPIDEAAKFSFWPRISQVPELVKYKDAVLDAEELLQQTGQDRSTSSYVHQVLGVFLRVVDIIWNVCDVLALPSLLLIFPILGYLLDRAIEYGIKIGEYSTVESRAKEAVRKLRSAEKKATDPKVKKEIQENIEKLEKNIKDAKKKDKSED